MIMKIKSTNVIINNLRDEIKYKLPLIAKTIQWMEGKDYIPTITSGNDGKHKANSLHYKNLAIDIRTKDMRFKEGNTLRIRKSLVNKYDVILEKDHIHIEYDPR